MRVHYRLLLHPAVMSSARIDFGESFNDMRAMAKFEEGDLHQSFAMALHKERLAQSEIDKQQRLLAELHAQLSETKEQKQQLQEQKQQLQDQALLASQDKVRVLRELRKVDNERKALRSTLAQLQENGRSGGNRRATRCSSISEPLLKSVQGELERLQQQMESARIVYEENERLKRECHSLTADLSDVKQELEAFSQKQAQKLATQTITSAGKEADAFFTVRHRRQGYMHCSASGNRRTRDQLRFCLCLGGMIKVTAEILIASIQGGSITPNGHEIVQPGDRILEVFYNYWFHVEI